MQKYRRLLAFARPQLRAFGLIAALSVFGSVMVALQPWPIKLIVDSVLQSEALPSAVRNIFDSLGVHPSKVTLVTLFALGGLAITALHIGSESWLAWNWTRAGRRVVFDTAEELFARLQRRSLLFHSRTPVG